MGLSRLLVLFTALSRNSPLISSNKIVEKTFDPFELVTYIRGRRKTKQRQN